MTTADNKANAAAERPGYAGVAIALHWIIAAMILGQIAGGFYMHNLPDGNQKFELYQLHKSTGITILLLSLVRLGWRLTHPAPPLPGGMPDWQRLLARGTHIGFYALMIGVPLGGWAIVSASPLAPSVPTYLFGAIPWPHLPFFDGVEDRKATAEAIAEMHELGAFSILGLFALHVAAALKHHFKDKDGVLARMLPFLKRAGSA
ncbi:MAG: cytochrome b [Alphaproteobacteria bacterium]|nr:cytochrome b [Alphaproteobacteria bacterium]